MKTLIKNVLDDMSTGQITLSSDSARELIATTITATLKSNGTYMKHSEMDKQVESEREKWVCSICGENTFEVDYDYIGSGTNHLGCELELDMKSEPDGDEIAKALGHMDEDGNYITEDKVSLTQIEKYKKEKEKAKQLIDKSVEDYERNKLSEEIVDDTDIGYIYESDDGGKTVYKREFGSDKKELVWSSDEKGKFNKRTTK
tara:strand:- start:125 stop:730 length:606 start_codon:yes stop_codon:yes gene_type:complete